MDSKKIHCTKYKILIPFLDNCYYFLPTSLILFARRRLRLSINCMQLFSLNNLRPLQQLCPNDIRAKYYIKFIWSKSFFKFKNIRLNISDFYTLTESTL